MIIEIDAGGGASGLAQERDWAQAARALSAKLAGADAPSGAAYPSSSNRPLVDILMPALNAERTIRLTLESVFAQTYPLFRVIVVDDGSTDSTVGVIREFKDRSQPILLVKSTRGGIVDALNLGLEYVTAPIVARFDADDISFPNRLADQVQFLSHNPHYVAVSSSFYEMDENGFLSGREYNGDGRELSPDLLDCPAYEPKLPHSLMTIRADVLKRLKYRYAHNAEDVDLWWRLLPIGKLAVMKEFHGCYRVHGDSVSGRNIVEGRIQAVSSQLAALSARRKLAAESDFEFYRSDLESARAARSLERMLDLFRARTSEQEWLHLRAASAMKLLELSYFRDHRLEASDAEAFLASIESLAATRADHRRKVRQSLSKAVRRFYRAATPAERVALIRRRPRQLLRAFLN